MNGQLCGKIWDDEVRAAPNLDVPFLEALLIKMIPSLRPADGKREVFFTGLSSGGYMTVRAATRLGDRSNVFGIFFDNETRRNISEVGACLSAQYPNEKPWEAPAGGARPPWRAFHHAQDGIHDRSCVEKVRRQLAQRGHPETVPFRLEAASRSADPHYWLDAYNAPLLDFFGQFCVGTGCPRR